MVRAGKGRAASHWRAGAPPIPVPAQPIPYPPEEMA